MIEKLKILIAAWEKDGQYFNGPGDHAEDRAIGRTYAGCAEELRAVVNGAPITTVEADAEDVCACEIPLLYSALATQCKRCGLNLRTA